MARGFERNGKKNAGRFSYANDFKREVLKATKKAGRQVGRLIVKDRQEALIADIKAKENKEKSGWRGLLFNRKERPSRRRISAVRSIVGRDGTLIALDHAPMAVMQETGGVIRAKGKKLKISRSAADARPGLNTFVTKKGLVFEIGKHRKPWRRPDGTLRPNQPPQARPILIAILLDEVIVPRLPESARLETIATRHLPRYRDLIEQYLVE